MARDVLAEFEQTLSEILSQGGDKIAEEWMENIEAEYGHAPLIYKRMAERPEVLISHLLYKEAVTRTSSLDPKYVELISMAVGAALRCRHCTSYHMQAAAKKGATREEILEVILLTGMISNSSVLANAYRIFDEKMAACIPCQADLMKKSRD